MRCCIEESLLKSVAKLLEMLLPVVAHTTLPAEPASTPSGIVLSSSFCVCASQQLFIVLAQLLLLLRHKK